jgi:hypothetical protein
MRLQPCLVGGRLRQRALRVVPHVAVQPQPRARGGVVLGAHLTAPGRGASAVRVVCRLAHGAVRAVAVTETRRADVGLAHEVLGHPGAVRHHRGLQAEGAAEAAVEVPLDARVHGVVQAHEGGGRRGADRGRRAGSARGGQHLQQQERGGNGDHGGEPERCQRTVCGGSSTPPTSIRHILRLWPLRSEYNGQSIMQYANLTTE